MFVGIYKNPYSRIYSTYFYKSLKAKKKKKIESRVLINEKNYQRLIIYFVIYVCSKSIKMLILLFHELQ